MWIWIFSYISFGIVTVLFYRLTSFEEDFIEFNYKINPCNKNKYKIIARFSVFFLWPIVLPFIFGMTIITIIYWFFKGIFLLFFDNE